MTRKLRMAFFGSSLVSAYWNGAATYYRGIIEALHARGHEITFYEPDAFARQQHRDLDVVPYARSVVYPPDLDGMGACLHEARAADVVVKCSGVGVLDNALEEAACVITDNWTGLEMFLEPGAECIAVENGAGVAAALETLSSEQARGIGRRAQQRVLAEHTYAQRAGQVEQCLETDASALSGT